MKKTLFVLLVLTFIFFACDNEGMSEIYTFIGTWERSWTDDDGDIHKETYTFTETEVTLLLQGFMSILTDFNKIKEPHCVTWEGTYTYSKSELIMTWERTDNELINDPIINHPSHNPFPIEESFNYQFINNTLIFSSDINNINKKYTRLAGTDH